jgi:hypothetical protein
MGAGRTQGGVSLWKLASREPAITITQNKKVLPVFLEQFAHN